MLPRFSDHSRVYCRDAGVFAVVWIADLVQQKMIFLLYDDRNHPGGFLLNLAAGLYGVVQCVADDHEQVCCGEIQPTVDPNLRPDRNAKFFGFFIP